MFFFLGSKKELEKNTNKNGDMNWECPIQTSKNCLQLTENLWVEANLVNFDFQTSFGFVLYWVNP